jgi:subtilisin family serine protease
MRILVVFCILVSYSFLVTDPNPWQTKVDPTLLENDSNSKIEFIVVLRDRLVFEKQLNLNTKSEKAKFVYQQLLNKAKLSQKSIVSFLTENKISHQAFYVTNAIKVTSNQKIIETLAKMNDVASIIADGTLRLSDYSENRTEIKSSRGGEPEWGLKMIKADSVWLMGIRGEGAIIGGQDTGFEWDVSPLKQKYRGFVDSNTVIHNYNWHDAIKINNPNFPDTVLNPCGLDIRIPCDDQNHGTHTMGTMVGEDENNSIGVAPGSKWMACRNMDRGWGRLSTYIECFEWFLAPYDLDGNNPNSDLAPHVINNSWYCSEGEGCNPSNFSLMEEVVKNVKASGIVVVVSAGNSGSACGSVTGPPAFFESSFSVGATNNNDNIAGFSSRGPVVIDSSFRLKPNVSAPGVGVRSVIRKGNFASYNGTSMAGPHVAGLVALMISANPDLAGRVDEIEDIIEATAMPKVSETDCAPFLGSQVPNAIFGYGRVDALAAVKRALAFTSSTIEDAADQQLNVFPNPTYDLLTFHLTNKQDGIDDISIYNLNGQKIDQIKLNSNHLLTTIDVNKYSSGIYLYSLRSGSKTFRGKFIKL